MCGICGIATVDRSQPVDLVTLRTMTDAIEYRGPDDSGTYISQGIGLGARRLSIIDVEHGHQPIHNEDETLHLVFNGELYNFHALRDRLERDGHRFRTNSDTEVVVHAYEKWGTSCLNLFRGMFAFGLWDAANDALLLAVDRFGIKPLYFGVFEGDVVFGSELVCLLASGRLAKDVDDAALAEYFTLGYVPPPATIFHDAWKLEPGTLLRWTPDAGVTLDRYWDVPATSNQAGNGKGLRRESREPPERELRELLRDAVRAHLVSDVPVGAFLSGGIDSSTVVALMSEVADEPVRTFSVGFEAREHDERPLARLVAKRFNTRHEELVLEPESADILPKLVSHFQEPFADSSALPTYYVSKLASSSVKVALSGDGGDEIFVGYTVFRGVELARYVQSLPPAVRRLMASVPAHLPQTFGPGWNDRVARWKKWASDTMLPPETAYRSKITMAGLPVLWPLLTSEFRHRLTGQNPFRAVDSALANAKGDTPLERMLYAGLKVSLPGDMLVKVDRMSMANSLEIRVPLLDHVVAEFVAKLPVATRFPRWRLKALLKDTMADVLPPEILRQRKHGFTIPLAAWFRGDLIEFAADTLLSREAADRGFLDKQALEVFLRRHASGNQNLGSAIWSLLMFELWCRRDPQLMRIFMLVQHPGARGPVPTHTAHLVEALRSLGCTVVTHPWGQREIDETLLGKLIQRPRDVLSVRRALRREEFDVAVIKTAHDWRTLLRDIGVSIFIRRRCRPVVLQLHGSAVKSLLGPGRRAFKAATTLLLALTDGMMVLSTEEQREWSAFRSQHPTFTAKNPYVSMFSGSHETRQAAKLNQRVLFVGRLIKEKGIFDLVDAIAVVLNDRECDLLIVGEGPQEHDLRHHIRRLGLDDYVTVAGYLAGSELSQRYREASVFVLPTSWDEGFPTVLTEAMDAGLPIITTPSAGRLIISSRARMRYSSSPMT